MGDQAAANRALDYLFNVQQRPDGSYPQNSRLSGEPVFGGLQMDEVSFPTVLAGQLGRTGSADWEHIRKAEDYVLANGPSTPGERWENAAGYSPATIAAEISGLVVGADIARKNGDNARAEHYLQVADSWRGNLDHWTVTTNGPLSSKPYFLRITADGDANAGTQIQLSDGGPLIDQREVLDPSFLELVRLGVLRPDDPRIAQHADPGRQVPRLLHAERAVLAPREFRRLRREGRRIGMGADRHRLGDHPRTRLAAAHRRARRIPARRRHRRAERSRHHRPLADDASWLLPEQVWDHQPPAGTGPDFQPGEPTFSATPLAWTHAQFIRLAWSIETARRSRPRSRSPAATRARSAIADPTSFWHAGSGEASGLVHPAIWPRGIRSAADAARVGLDQAGEMPGWAYVYVKVANAPGCVEHDLPDAVCLDGIGRGLVGVGVNDLAVNVKGSHAVTGARAVEVIYAGDGKRLSPVPENQPAIVVVDIGAFQACVAARVPRAGRRRGGCAGGTHERQDAGRDEAATPADTRTAFRRRTPAPEIIERLILSASFVAE